MDHSPRNYVAAEKKARFLEALRESGLNVTAACKKAGIASRAGVYTQRAVDLDFAQQWSAIEEELLDTLEELQYKEALVRGEDRRWVLARLRPKFSERRHTHITGEVAVRSVRDMSDEELEMILARGRVAVEPADYAMEDRDHKEEQGDDEPDGDDHGGRQESR